MADTFSSLNVHFVFKTKNRQPLPMDEIKERFWAFMGGIAKQNEIKPLCIGGVAGHVHLLLSLPTTMWSRKRCGLSKVDPRLGRMKPLTPSGNLPGVWLRSVHGVSLMLRKRLPISKIRRSIIGSEASRKNMSVSKETRYRL
jgi:Transposase IS200 like